MDTRDRLHYITPGYGYYDGDDGNPKCFHVIKGTAVFDDLIEGMIYRDRVNALLSQ